MHQEKQARFEMKQQTNKNLEARERIASQWKQIITKQAFQFLNMYTKKVYKINL